MVFSLQQKQGDEQSASNVFSIRRTEARHIANTTAKVQPPSGVNKEWPALDGHTTEVTTRS